MKGEDGDNERIRPEKNIAVKRSGLINPRHSTHKYPLLLH